MTPKPDVNILKARISGAEAKLALTIEAEAAAARAHAVATDATRDARAVLAEARLALAQTAPLGKRALEVLERLFDGKEVTVRYSKPPAYGRGYGRGVSPEYITAKKLEVLGFVTICTELVVDKPLTLTAAGRAKVAGLRDRAAAKAKGKAK